MSVARYNIKKFDGKEDFTLWKTKIKAIIDQQKTLKSLTDPEKLLKAITQKDKELINSNYPTPFIRVELGKFKFWVGLS